MKRSETIVELIKAVIKAKPSFKLATFDKSNPAFADKSNPNSSRGKYASLPSVLSAVEDALQANGLTIMNLTYEGKIMTTLFHESGEWIGCELTIPTGISPQDTGKAITYFRRYAICCLLSISTGEEDDDGNSAEQAHVAKQKATQVSSNGKLSVKQASEIIELINGDHDLFNKILAAYQANNLNDIDAIHYQKIIDRLKATKLK